MAGSLFRTGVGACASSQVQVQAEEQSGQLAASTYRGSTVERLIGNGHAGSTNGPYPSVDAIAEHDACYSSSTVGDRQVHGPVLAWTGQGPVIGPDELGAHFRSACGALVSCCTGAASIGTCAAIQAGDIITGVGIVLFAAGQCHRCGKTGDRHQVKQFHVLMVWVVAYYRDAPADVNNRIDH